MFKRLTALAVVAAVGMAMPALAQETKEKSKDQPKVQTPSTPSKEQPKKDEKKKEAEITLKVGDKAPMLSVEEWVKGSKVEKFEEGKVYVVEFWATWCGPCIKSIPHLTELQTEYKDKGVTVIGVASSEKGTDAEAKLEGVKKFVGDKKDEMKYVVAYDADRSMSKAWMTPAGRNTIPTAFVIGKDGKIAWIGNPSSGLDDAIKKAVASGGKAMGPATVPTITLVSQEGAKQEGKKDQPEGKKDQKAKADDQTDDGALKLFMGDKAPALSVEDWVKGDKVEKFQKGKVYVIEFWATWCGPCIAAMPHLTETAKEYKDKGVTVIGVAGSERGSDSTKKLEKVKKFVEDKGEGMGYTVAYDNDRSMSKTWMEPAGQGGIPCTFIINGEGKIAWIGHPMGMDEPLKAIVDGKWDLAAESAKTRKAAEAEAKSQKLMEQFQEAMQNGDQEKAMGLVDDIIAANPQMAGLAGTKFKMLGEKDNAKAYAWANKAIDGPIKDSAQALNAIAWTIVDPEDNTFTKKDLDLALKAAMRADELTKHKDAAIMDTLAKVYFDKGDVTKALEIQTKAVKALDDGPEAQKEQFEKELKERLDQYKDAAKKKGA